MYCPTLNIIIIFVAIYYCNVIIIYGRTKVLYLYLFGYVQYILYAIQ